MCVPDDVGSHPRRGNIFSLLDMAPTLGLQDFPGNTGAWNYQWEILVLPIPGNTADFFKLRSTRKYKSNFSFVGFNQCKKLFRK